jgi:hypothetical protein
MSRFAIQRLNSGGVITNYHCVSRCGHCLYNCSPRRKKNYLEPTTAETIFQRIAEMGCRSVHIGGGEPLLNPDKLLIVLESARRVGVGIEYVETNSAWFVDDAQVMAVLEDLRSAGVDTLLASISPFHNAFIPYARVKGVIDACRQTGMAVFPWVNAFVRDLTRLDETRPHAMDEFTERFGPDYLQRIPDRYWIHMGGRALDTFRPFYPQHAMQRILAESPSNCIRALSDTSHFHIDLYGNYIPGLCAGLAIAMEDLGGPLPPDRYPLLDVLATAGIRGLLDLARTDYGFTPRREKWMNHCDLCTDIRHFLLHTNRGRFAELAPSGFYDTP